MNSPSLQYLFGPVLLYALSFVFVLFVGLGSIWYYALKSQASDKVLQHFIYTLPIALKKIYSEGVEDISPRSADLSYMRSIGLCIIGSIAPILVTFVFLRVMFLSNNLANQIVNGGFAVLEVLTLLYFLTLGRRIIAIKKTSNPQLENYDNEYDGK